MSWSPQPWQWSLEEQSLLSAEIKGPSDVSLSTVIEKSDVFPHPFPIDVNRCKSLQSKVAPNILERNINSVYPILHENVFHLYAEFILHKRKHGTSVEKSLYNKINLLDFVDRLLTKRAITFMGKWDFYILLDGKSGKGGWENVGTTKEKPPLILKDCLSYEEMKLSAFLSVSSYTYFMNIGDRKNFGKVPSNREMVQEDGIIMGIIGPRLVKKGVMEYQELIISESQNTKNKGYGKSDPPTIHQLFSKFYEEECLEYADVIKMKNSPRFIELENGEIFDNLVYSKRLLFSIDTLLIEANQRALERNTKAYIHVVGIGLGVWAKSSCQNKLFMDACGERIKELGPYLHNVSDICFAYITHNACLNYKHGDVIPIEGHPLKGIKLHMYKREPHTKLRGSDTDKLLVVSYAWDGNSMPGNEYWNKKLGSSGDSAAASSTQISELHNPYINPKVCAANLKLVVANKVVGIGEYITMKKKNII